MPIGVSFSLRAGHVQFKIFKILFVCQIESKFAFDLGIFWTLMSTKSVKNSISGLTWFALHGALRKTEILKCSFQTMSNRKWNLYYFLYTLEFKNYRNKMQICIQWANTTYLITVMKTKVFFQFSAKFFTKSTINQKIDRRINCHK